MEECALSQKRPLPHTPFHEHQTKRVCDVETPEAIRVRSPDPHSFSQKGPEPTLNTTLVPSQVVQTQHELDFQITSESVCTNKASSS